MICPKYCPQFYCLHSPHYVITPMKLGLYYRRWLGIWESLISTVFNMSFFINRSFNTFILPISQSFSTSKWKWKKIWPDIYWITATKWGGLSFTHIQQHVWSWYHSWMHHCIYKNYIECPCLWALYINSCWVLLASAWATISGFGPQPQNCGWMLTYHVTPLLSDTIFIPLFPVYFDPTSSPSLPITFFFLMFISLCLITLMTNNKEHSMIAYCCTGLPTPNINCWTALWSTYWLAPWNSPSPLPGLVLVPPLPPSLLSITQSSGLPEHKTWGAVHPWLKDPDWSRYSFEPQWQHPDNLEPLFKELWPQTLWGTHCLLEQGRLLYHLPGLQ